MDVCVDIVVEFMVWLLLICRHWARRAPMYHHSRFWSHIYHRLRVVLVLCIVLMIDRVLVNALIWIIFVYGEWSLLLFDVEVLASCVRLTNILFHTRIVGRCPSQMVKILHATQVVVEIIWSVIVAKVELINIILDRMSVGSLERLTTSSGATFSLIL